MEHNVPTGIEQAVPIVLGAHRITETSPTDDHEVRIGRMEQAIEELKADNERLRRTLLAMAAAMRAATATVELILDGGS